ncbi:baseplate J/gp47 family protein [Leuconostoc carnosum]|uniref:baseplate J/gp47 family protein n=1 Tax=Leuconostoc TaxID=1243 RepID=UPI00123BB97D|nr:baseplate J/gp47 family protein [Leuconostoc carnosum]KAA8371096.1 baseplate J/gp47 family protein [Leuconostoc carnosum]KAA8382737.1 baseplate J/gp47 family protein [Leuconostoc carnosum]
MTTPEQLAQNMQQFTADYFLSNGLNRVPDNIDTRQGAIIYDAMAPLALGYQELALNMRNIMLESYIQTATGEYLDYRAQEKGAARKQATAAEVSAEFYNDNGELTSVEEGDRFATMSANSVFFTVKQTNGQGSAILVAESTGTGGNSYLGQILPVTANDNISVAKITKIVVPARDNETDEELRYRLLETSNVIRYGGNVSDYVDMTLKQDSIGGVQVYPVWNGGGTVRLVIINNAFDVPSPELINAIKTAIDPSSYEGKGYGLAPIGHAVTVAAPTIKTIAIAMKVVVDGATTVETARQNINKALSDIFLNLRKKWDTLTNARDYVLTIYRAAIIGEIIKINGVVNIENLRLNGQDTDISLIFSSSLQELPILGEVTLNG